MGEANVPEDDYRNYEYTPADAIFSEKLKTLYVNRDKCVTATLYRDDDGHVFVFWYWLTNHGIGPDHRSCVVESAEELREALLPDAGDWVGRETVERLCAECGEFFDR